MAERAERLVAEMERPGAEGSYLRVLGLAHACLAAGGVAVVERDLPRFLCDLLVTPFKGQTDPDLLPALLAALLRARLPRSPTLLGAFLDQLERRLAAEEDGRYLRLLEALLREGEGARPAAQRIGQLLCGCRWAMGMEAYYSLLARVVREDAAEVEGWLPELQRFALDGSTAPQRRGFLLACKAMALHRAPGLARICRRKLLSPRNVFPRFSKQLLRAILASGADPLAQATKLLPRLRDAPAAVACAAFEVFFAAGVEGQGFEYFHLLLEALLQGLEGGEAGETGPRLGFVERLLGHFCGQMA